MASRPGSGRDGGRSRAHFSMSGPTAATSRWMVLGETARPEAKARLSDARRQDWLRAASWQSSFAAAGVQPHVIPSSRSAGKPRRPAPLRTYARA